MVASVATQLRCSLWRHYLDRLRTWPWLLCSVLVCLLPLAVLVFVKLAVPLQHQPKCEFRGRSISLNSPVQLIQGLVCNIDNRCHQDLPEDQVYSYPGAKINSILSSSVWDFLAENLSPSSPTLSSRSSLLAGRPRATVDGSSAVWDLLSEMPQVLGIITKLGNILHLEPVRGMIDRGLFVGDLLFYPASSSEAKATYAEVLYLTENQTELLLNQMIDIAGVVQTINSFPNTSVYEDDLTCPLLDIFRTLILIPSNNTVDDSGSASASPSTSPDPSVAVAPSEEEIMAVLKKVADAVCVSVTVNSTEDILRLAALVDWSKIANGVSTVLVSLENNQSAASFDSLLEMAGGVRRLLPLAPLLTSLQSVRQAVRPLAGSLQYLSAGGWTAESLLSFYRGLQYFQALGGPTGIEGPMDSFDEDISSAAPTTGASVNSTRRKRDVTDTGTGDQEHDPESDTFAQWHQVLDPVLESLAAKAYRLVSLLTFVRRASDVKALDDEFRWNKNDSEGQANFTDGEDGYMNFSAEDGGQRNLMIETAVGIGLDLLKFVLRDVEPMMDTAPSYDTGRSVAENDRSDPSSGQSDFFRFLMTDSGSVCKDSSCLSSTLSSTPTSDSQFGRNVLSVDGRNFISSGGSVVTSSPDPQASPNRSGAEGVGSIVALVAQAAANITKAADVLARVVGVDLPQYNYPLTRPAILALLRLFDATHHAISLLTATEPLSERLCQRSSWLTVTDADWRGLEERLCHNASRQQVDTLSWLLTPAETLMQNSNSSELSTVFDSEITSIIYTFDHKLQGLQYDLSSPVTVRLNDSKNNESTTESVEPVNGSNDPTTNSSPVFFGRNIAVGPSALEIENGSRTTENSVTPAGENGGPNVTGLLETLIGKLVPNAERFQNSVFSNLSRSMLAIYSQPWHSNGTGTNAEVRMYSLEAAVEHLTEFSSSTLSSLMGTLANLSYSKEPSRTPLFVPREQDTLSLGLVPSVGLRLTAALQQSGVKLPLPPHPAATATLSIIRLTRDLYQAILNSGVGPTMLTNLTATRRLLAHAAVVPHLVPAVAALILDPKLSTFTVNEFWPCGTDFGSSLEDIIAEFDPRRESEAGTQTEQVGFKNFLFGYFTETYNSDFDLAGKMKNHSDEDYQDQLFGNLHRLNETERLINVSRNAKRGVRELEDFLCANKYKLMNELAVLDPAGRLALPNGLQLESPSPLDALSTAQLVFSLVQLVQTPQLDWVHQSILNLVQNTSSGADYTFAPFEVQVHQAVNLAVHSTIRSLLPLLDFGYATFLSFTPQSPRGNESGGLSEWVASGQRWVDWANAVLPTVEEYKSTHPFLLLRKRLISGLAEQIRGQQSSSAPDDNKPRTGDSNYYPQHQSVATPSSLYRSAHRLLKTVAKQATAAVAWVMSYVGREAVSLGTWAGEGGPSPTPEKGELVFEMLMNDTLHRAVDVFSRLQGDIVWHALDTFLLPHTEVAQALSRLQVFFSWLRTTLEQFNSAPLLSSTSLTMMDFIDLAVFSLEKSSSSPNLTAYCNGSSVENTDAEKAFANKLCSLQWGQIPKELLESWKYEELLRNLSQLRPLSTKQLADTVTCCLAAFKTLWTDKRNVQYATFSGLASNTTALAETINSTLKWLGLSGTRESLYADELHLSDLERLARLVMAGSTALRNIMSPTLLSTLSAGEAPTLQLLAVTLGPRLPLVLGDMAHLLRAAPDKLVTWLYSENPCKAGIFTNTTNLSNTLSSPACEDLLQYLPRDLQKYWGLNNLMDVTYQVTPGTAADSALRTLLLFGLSSFTLATDPAAFFQWPSLDNVTHSVLGIGAEEYWTEKNRFQILASLVNPIVLLSRNESQPATFTLAGRLVATGGLVTRLGQLLGVVRQGGDVWEKLMMLYSDKPVVVSLLEHVENTPKYVLQYVRLFGRDYQHLAKLLMNPTADTLCSIREEIVAKLETQAETSFSRSSFGTNAITASSESETDRFSNATFTTTTRGELNESTIASTESSVPSTESKSTTSEFVTMDSYLRSLVDENKELFGLLYFLCEEVTNLTLLLQQLDPTSQPIIGTEVMPIDAATLSLLLDGVLTDAAGVLVHDVFGPHTANLSARFPYLPPAQESAPLQLPLWLKATSWQDTLSELDNLLASWSLLDTAETIIVDMLMVSNTSHELALQAAHVLLQRLVHSSSADRGLALSDLAHGFPGLQKVLTNLEGHYSDLAATMLWLPDSRLFPHLLSALAGGPSPYLLLCNATSNAEDLLYHPYLSDGDWQAILGPPCSYSTEQFFMELSNFSRLGNLAKELENFDGLNSVFASLDAVKILVSSGRLDLNPLKVVLLDNAFVKDFLNKTWPERGIYTVRELLNIGTQVILFSQPGAGGGNSSSGEGSPWANTVKAVVDVASRLLGPLTGAADYFPDSVSSLEFSVMDTLLEPSLLRGLFKDYASTLQSLFEDYAQSADDGHFEDYGGDDHEENLQVDLRYDLIDTFKARLRILEVSFCKAYRDYFCRNCTKVAPYLYGGLTSSSKGVTDNSTMFSMVWNNFMVCLDDFTGMFMKPFCSWSAYETFNTTPPNIDAPSSFTSSPTGIPPPSTATDSVFSFYPLQHVLANAASVLMNNIDALIGILRVLNSQLGRTEHYHDLFCGIDNDTAGDLGSVVEELMEEFNWADDLQQLMSAYQYPSLGSDQSCYILQEQLINTSMLVSKLWLKFHTAMNLSSAVPMSQQCPRSLLSGPLPTQLKGLLLSLLSLSTFPPEQLQETSDTILGTLSGTAPSLYSLGSVMSLPMSLVEVQVQNSSLIAAWMGHPNVLMDANKLLSFTDISEMVSYFDVDEKFDSLFFTDTPTTYNQTEQQTQRSSTGFKRSTHDSSVDNENENLNLIGRRKRDTAASYSSSPAAVESLNALRRLRGQLGSKAFVELLSSSLNNSLLEHEVPSRRLWSSLDPALFLTLLPHLTPLVHPFLLGERLVNQLTWTKVVSNSVEKLPLYNTSLNLLQIDTLQDSADSLISLLSSAPLSRPSLLQESLQQVQEGLHVLTYGVVALQTDSHLPFSNLFPDGQSFRLSLSQLSSARNSSVLLTEPLLALLEDTLVSVPLLLSAPDGVPASVFCGSSLAATELFEEAFLVPDVTSPAIYEQLRQALCGAANDLPLMEVLVDHLRMGPLYQKFAEACVDAGLSPFALTSSELAGAVVWVKDRLLPMLPSIRGLAGQLGKAALGDLRSSKSTEQQTKMRLKSFGRSSGVPDEGDDYDAEAKSLATSIGSMLCGGPVELPQQIMRMLSRQLRPPVQGKKEDDGNKQRGGRHAAGGDSSRSDKCDSLFNDLQLSKDHNSATTALLRRFVAPFVAGKIIYTPQNAATAAIVANANSTLQVWGVQQQMLMLLEDMVDAVFSSGQVATAVKEVSWLLREPTIVKLMTSLLPGAIGEQLKELLDELAMYTDPNTSGSTQAGQSTSQDASTTQRQVIQRAATHAIEPVTDATTPLESTTDVTTTEERSSSTTEEATSTKTSKSTNNISTSTNELSSSTITDLPSTMNLTLNVTDSFVAMSSTTETSDFTTVEDPLSVGPTPLSPSAMDTFKRLLAAIRPLLQLSGCIQLDRFMATNDTDGMNKAAKEAYKADQFLAGVVFDNLGSSGSTSTQLPTEVKYTIRVDAARSPSTQQGGPTFWRPGPYADYGDQLLYHQGFVILQNTLDEAIMKTQYQQESLTRFSSMSGSRFVQNRQKVLGGRTILETNTNSLPVQGLVDTNSPHQVWLSALGRLREFHSAVVGERQGKSESGVVNSAGTEVTEDDGNEDTDSSTVLPLTRSKRAVVNINGRQAAVPSRNNRLDPIHDVYLNLEAHLKFQGMEHYDPGRNFLLGSYLTYNSIESRPQQDVPNSVGADNHQVPRYLSASNILKEPPSDRSDSFDHIYDALFVDSADEAFPDDSNARSGPDYRSLDILEDLIYPMSPENHHRIRRSSFPEQRFSGINISTMIDQKKEADALLQMQIYTVQQPYPCYSRDLFLQSVNESPALNLLLTVVAFLCFQALLVKQRVEEQTVTAGKLEGVLRLRPALPLLSWTLYSVLLLLVMTALMALLSKLGGLQPLASLEVIFILLLTYGLTIIAFCYLVGLVFRSALLAVLCAVLLSLLGNAPFVLVSLSGTPPPIHVMALLSLFAPSAFGFGFRVICQFELAGVPATLGNLWTPPTMDSGMTVGLAVVLLLVDTLLLVLLSLLVHGIRAGCSNGHHHWRTGSKVSPLDGDADEETPDEKTDQGSEINSVDLDPGLKQSLKLGLSLKGVRKVYYGRKGLSTLAVDNLNLDLYEGQVLALLGHNGAGKSTVISMVAGETSPTAGTITVPDTDEDDHRPGNHASLRSRATIGLVPQKAVMPLHMTVEETLYYFAALKGVPSGEVAKEVAKCEESMGLAPHRRHMCEHLSGGLQTRLAVALAFLGQSRVVVLDEPTAGVDPVARHAIWELILHHRPGRTILLTTHFLDEAEALADRVAIMDQGKLICVGSPLDLKLRYGHGHSLTISRKRGPAGNSTNGGVKARRNTFADRSSQLLLDDQVLEGTDQVTFAVRRFVPNCTLLEECDGQLTFALPPHDATGRHNSIVELLEHMESELDTLGYTSLDVRPSSLEDVLVALKVVEPTEPDSEYLKALQFADYMDGARHQHSLRGSLPPSSGARLWFKKLAALLYKHALHDTRDLLFYILVLVVPLSLVVLAVVVAKLRPHAAAHGSLHLHQQLYGDLQSAFTRTLDPLYLPLRDTLANDLLPQLSPEYYSALTAAISTPQEWEKAWPSCPQRVLDTSGEVCGDENPFGGALNSTQCMCSGTNGTGPECIVEVPKTINLTHWIMSTRKMNTNHKRFGLTLGIPDSRLHLSSSQSGQAPASGNVGASVWYDNSAYHTLPVALNALNNGRLRRLMQHDNYTITATSKPIVFEHTVMGKVSLGHYIADLCIGLLLLVSVSVLCSYCAGRTVEDRIRGTRRLYHVMGASLRQYWLAAFLWDATVLLLNVLLSVVILMIFGQPHFVAGLNLPAFILLCYLYGLSLLPLYYLLERLFSHKNSAVIAFFFATFAVGFLTSVVVITCQVYSWIKPMHSAGQYLQYAFLVFPPYIFASAIKDIALAYTKSEIFSVLGQNSLPVNPFELNTALEGAVGLHLLLLFLHGLLCWLLLLLFAGDSVNSKRRCCGNKVVKLRPHCMPLSMTHKNGGCTDKMAQGLDGGACIMAQDDGGMLAGEGWRDLQVDTDVQNERLRVQEGWPSSGAGVPQLIRVAGLTKVYDNCRPHKVAIDDLYFALQKGECLGLVGVNGAGKSSTFGCLTGDLAPSAGSITLNGLPLSDAFGCSGSSGSGDSHALFGYCPQTNTALDPKLTPTEHLTLACLIRGIRLRDRKKVIAKAVSQLRLTGCERTLTARLSEGTKRKVSLATALIGDPQLLLLDEPTSGLDLESRRLVLSLLQTISKDARRGILLSSHNLEDVARLSRRVAVVVNGRFVALGSSQHITSKYGKHLTIQVKTSSTDQLEQLAVVHHLRQRIPSLQLKAHHSRLVSLQCSSAGQPLHAVFAALEAAKQEAGVLEYTIAQTTFEQVFRLLTAQQNDGSLTDDFGGSTTTTTIDDNDADTIITMSSPSSPGAFDSQRPHSNGLPKGDVDPDRPKKESANRRSLYDNVDVDDAIASSNDSPARLLKHHKRTNSSGSAKLTPVSSPTLPHRLHSAVGTEQRDSRPSTASRDSDASGSPATVRAGSRHATPTRPAHENPSIKDDDDSPEHEEKLSRGLSSDVEDSTNF